MRPEYQTVARRGTILAHPLHHQAQGLRIARVMLYLILMEHLARCSTLYTLYRHDTGFVGIVEIDQHPAILGYITHRQQHLVDVLLMKLTV